MASLRVYCLLLLMQLLHVLDICEVLCQEAIVVHYRVCLTQCTQFSLTTLDMPTLSMSSDKKYCYNTI